MIPPDSFASSVEKHGFAVLPRVVAPEMCENLRCLFAAAGHGQRHLLNLPDIRELAMSTFVRALVQPVLGDEAFAVRGLYFDKTADANWDVVWHQDLTIAVAERHETPGYRAWSVKENVAHVQPPTGVLERMLTVRLHLDDCGEENGPLLVIPGSHEVGKMTTERILRWRREKPPIACPVFEGGALLLRPLLLHASRKSRRPAHRRVIHLEFANRPLPAPLAWRERI